MSVLSLACCSSGLEAMHEEIDDMSKRSTEEMRGIVEGILDGFRDDLSDVSSLLRLCNDDDDDDERW